MKIKPPRLTATRFLTIVAVALGLGFAASPVAYGSGEANLAWVLPNTEAAKGSKLSNGASVDSTIAPGQWVELLAGGAKPLAQWRPPSDIEKRWFPKNAGRVSFSHERHFGMIGSKNCLTCHADEKGMGSTDARPSLAAVPQLEPHGEHSLGRFCASCHNGVQQAASIEGAKPTQNVTIFSATGKTGDASCSHCHVPASHGSDFVPSHKVFASSNVQQCSACHRGNQEISRKLFGQAKEFVAAQQQLLKNPDDTAAFSHTLPNQFCTYCHITQNDFWKVGK